MIGFFKKKAPANILVLAVMSFFLKWHLFNHPLAPIRSDRDGKLYSFLVEQLSILFKENNLWFSWLSFFIIFFQAIFLNHIVNAYRLLPKFTYLPGMTLILCTSLFPNLNYFSAPLLSSCFVFYFFSKLIQSYHQSTIRTVLYNMGLALGISIFIYQPIVILIFWVLFGLLILRTFSIAEWIMVIIGVLTPFYFYGSYLFISDQWQISKLFKPIIPFLPQLEFSYLFLISIILLFLIFVLGGYALLNQRRKMLVLIRKSWWLWFCFFLFSWVLLFLGDGKNISNFYFLVLSVSLIQVGFYFYINLKRVATLLFWIHIILIAIVQYNFPFIK